MGKFFLKFLFTIIIFILITIGYLSFFGVKTDRFDNIIKTKANEVNKNVKLEFNKTKIHLNPTELNLVVKLQNPRILVKGNQIDLSKLNLFLFLKSFFTSDFLLKRAEIAFVKNDVKDLSKITNIFIPSFINKRFNKVFKKGNLEGEFVIPFREDGSIDEDYSFSGKITEATINITKEFSITNLTTEINRTENNDVRGFVAKVKTGNVFGLDLSGTQFNYQKDGDIRNIATSLNTKGELTYAHTKKALSFLAFKNNFFSKITGKIDLKTEIVTNIKKNLKIENSLKEVTGKIFSLEAQTKESLVLKQYLPDYDSKIVIKDASIKFSNLESNQKIKVNGYLKTKNEFDQFEINEKYNYDQKDHDVKGVINLTNSKVNISRLNYIKSDGEDSKLNFDINFILNKYLEIKNLNFSSGKSMINVSNTKLNNHLEIIDFEKLEVLTFVDGVKNNDFVINKTNKVIATGKIFDVQPLLKSLYKKGDKKNFSKKFNSEIKVDFDKAITGTNDDVLNLTMIASINQGSYNKMILKGNFSENELIEMSIYKIDENKKTLQVISDRARPFVKNFDFIEGFEGGKLDYESIISKKKSSSNLLISNFKVSKVPALAKLLSLASLQGIADTLSGEGIRFDSFEMKTNSEGNVMNIEDALAIGPAVSILLDGYIDKGKTVSLRGTLVPATKLNSIIASIPLVGDILVGKKTGEGVVGVSFKMKGPPKDIKTTVNPIKTLTPRFIVRAVEKMKKKKKEETK